MSLRPDQVEARGNLLHAFQQGAREVLALFPTGYGKTHLAADIFVGVAAHGGTAGFFTDRSEIAYDTVGRLRARGQRVGLVMADEEPDPDAPLQVISIPTCRARGLVPKVRLAAWDEAHHLGSPTWGDLFDQVRGLGARSLGLTATAQRGDGRPLSMFTALVQGPSTRWCMDRGLLVECDVIAPPGVEENGLACSPVEAYQRFAPGTRALVFCANVAHVKETVAAFLAAGIAAESLVGSTAAATRRGARDRLASGEVRVLVGCGVFIEGFDAPSCETVILARSFGVTGTFLQAIGRGLRLSPQTGKRRCTVIDLRGSVHAHGLPDEERVWSLSGKAVVRAEVSIALRRCPVVDCGAIFRTAPRCPRCGAVAVAAQRVPRVLNKAERMALLERLPQRERDRRYLERLEQIAATRMRKPDWAAKAWALQQFVKTRGRKPEGVAA